MRRLLGAVKALAGSGGRAAAFRRFDKSRIQIGRDAEHATINLIISFSCFTGIISAAVTFDPRDKDKKAACFRSDISKVSAPEIFHGVIIAQRRGYVL